MVELTELVVCAIDRLEGNPLDRVGGEIGSVALVFDLRSAVFNLVQGTMELGICQLVNQSTVHVEADCAVSEHNITDGE